jgi:hypothetical protein
MRMAEVWSFDINRADARVNADSSLTVRLYYPERPRPSEKRIPENLEFGISVFERLLGEDYSPIADADNPIGPASAGSLYVFKDNRVVCHRRDRFAPTHRMYHSAYSGYPSSKEVVFSERGLQKTARRETAEECLLVTREAKPWLVVPNDSREETIESAKRLGLNLRPMFVDVETMEPRDTLEVYDSSGSLIFRTRANLDFMYESATSLNALQLRRHPLSSDEVLPIDAEGMFRGGAFVHFNRESYVLDLDRLRDLRFGSVLPDPEVHQTRVEGSSPVIFRPEYTQPYLGPDKVPVIDPHIWAPDNLLARALDALDVRGFNWMEIELWKERLKLEGNSLLPEKVLAR